MSLVRPVQASSMPGTDGPWLANSASRTNANAVLVGLSKDRTTSYFAFNSGTTYKLQQSVDDGVTLTDIHSFSETVLGLVETDDGECVVITQSVSANPGYLYKSTGWATSRTTATWAKKLTTFSGYIRPVWGAHRWSHSGTTFVTSEYGQQTNISTTDPNDLKATRVYVSTDSANTFTQVLNLISLFPGIYPLHVHACAYDPMNDRLWVTYGDTAAGGANSVDALYSDDWRAKLAAGQAATWTSDAVPTEWQGYSNFQDTTIGVLEGAVITFPDGLPAGPHVRQRRGYRSFGPITVASSWGVGTGAQGISYCLFKAYSPRTAPLLFANGGLANVNGGLVHLSPDDGLTWVEIFRDATNGSSVTFVAGPTISGKILWQVDTTFWSADLVVPGSSGPAGGTAKFSGDGATTAFVIPHGLGTGYKPSKRSIEAETAAAAATNYTTADATNITVTYTAAPAAAPTRTVTDGVLNSTRILTSATAAFTDADRGGAISGTGIPAGTTITSVASATSVTISAAATATASGVSVTITTPNVVLGWTAAP